MAAYHIQFNLQHTKATHYKKDVAKFPHPMQIIIILLYAFGIATNEHTRIRHFSTIKTTKAGPNK